MSTLLPCLCSFLLSLELLIDCVLIIHRKSGLTYCSAHCGGESLGPSYNRIPLFHSLSSVLGQTTASSASDLTFISWSLLSICCHPCHYSSHLNFSSVTLTWMPFSPSVLGAIRLLSIGRLSSGNSGYNLLFPLGSCGFTTFRDFWVWISHCGLPFSFGDSHPDF